jgi:hypothetical protein
MKLAWISIDDIEAASWLMTLVFSKVKATRLSSGNAQQATRGARQEFPEYRWEKISAFRQSGFIVQGLSK